MLEICQIILVIVTIAVGAWAAFEAVAYFRVKQRLEERGADGARRTHRSPGGVEPDHEPDHDDGHGPVREQYEPDYDSEYEY